MGEGLGGGARVCVGVGVRVCPGLTEMRRGLPGGEKRSDSARMNGELTSVPLFWSWSCRLRWGS